MNILYTTNDIFCSKVGTAICSVFENNKSMEDIHIYIIGQDISSENKQRFQNLAVQYSRLITVIDLGNLKNYFSFDFDTLGWNPVVLARLLLDKLLPETVDKVLYMDGDTVVLDSLDDLWYTPLHEHVLGGCIEATVNRTRRTQLQMEHLAYINSGVLLINLKKWRETHTGDKIIEYYRSRGGALFAPDQDAINGALLDQIFYLPPKYNFYNIYWTYSYKFLKHLLGDAPYYDPETFSDSVRHPVIIHYLGEERPWRKGNRHRFKSEYQKYLRKTPWRDESEETGWTLYFFCWNIFNFCMKPFPALRYHIIDGLIPVFMKWRRHQRTK